MTSTVFVLVAAAIFGLGVHGLLVSAHIMRKLLALNLMLSALFLLLIVVPATLDGRPDPVPQALVLTGIVIAVSTTAFALALMVRLFGKQGHATILPDIDASLLGRRHDSHDNRHNNRHNNRHDSRRNSRRSPETDGEQGP